MAEITSIKSVVRDQCADFAVYLHTHGCTGLRDDIDRRLAQLNSLLMSCYGGGQENFENLSPVHRDRLMWLASDLALEVEQKFELLSGFDRQSKQTD
jgi:hypothetical protein